MVLDVLALPCPSPTVHALLRAVDSDGLSPLHLAATTSGGSGAAASGASMAALLATLGAPVELKDAEGRTALGGHGPRAWRMGEDGFGELEGG